MDQKPAEDVRDERAADDDDVEGHSLSLVMGMDALGRSRERTKQPKRTDEELAPLTKTFPRMKDDSRK